MIIYTCPKCGHDLQSELLTCDPPIHRDYCPSCGWEHSKLEKIERIPYGGNDLDNAIYDIKPFLTTTDESLPLESLLEKMYFVEPINIIPKACENCPSHPKNGGSGICNCTLGQMEIMC